MVQDAAQQPAPARPLRLTIVSDTFPPEVNGVAMTLGRLAQGLATRGHAVTVVTARRPDRQHNVVEGPNIVEVPSRPIPFYTSLRFAWPAFKQLKALWKRERPDLVHIATETFLGWSAARLAREMGLPIVTTFHTNFHDYTARYGAVVLRPVIRAWLRHIHRKARCCFAPTEEGAARLRKLRFGRVEVFGRGVDGELFHPRRRDAALRATWGADPDTVVTLYVGRLAEEKNVALALRAARRLGEQVPKWRGVVVGDGPERERLQQEFPDIHFAGERYGEDLGAHYASGDCFLFGSTTETFGNVVTEAMASGLVVLAYDYAAPARFIVPGANGFTVPLGDEEAFLAAAADLAQERARWPAIGEAARQSLLSLSWDDVLDAFALRLHVYARSVEP